MDRARGTRIGGRIYGVESGCQVRVRVSKCKDSNAFTVSVRHMQTPSLPHWRASIARDATGSARHFLLRERVFGNSMRRNVLQRPLGSVALRLRGAYLFEVDRRPVLERARP